MNSNKTKAMPGRVLSAILVSLLVSVSQAQADDVLQTNWIELVRGFQDEESGVEVREVVNDETGATHLTIAIPKIRMADIQNMEEVRVVGQRPKEFDMKRWLPNFDYEWVEDYDNDYFGLLVHFNEEQRMPLRLYFSTETGYLQPLRP